MSANIPPAKPRHLATPASMGQEVQSLQSGGRYDGYLLNIVQTITDRPLVFFMVFPNRSDRSVSLSNTSAVFFCLGSLCTWIQRKHVSRRYFSPASSWPALSLFYQDAWLWTQTPILAHLGEGTLLERCCVVHRIDGRLGEPGSGSGCRISTCLGLKLEGESL